VNGRDDDALLALYQHLADRKAAGKKAIRDMPADERRAYTRDAVRRHRAKVQADKEAGRTEPTADAIRTALADAAIMLLATDGPGSREVRNALARAFPGMPGLPMTVAQRARSGALKPKLLGLPGTSLKSS